MRESSRSYPGRPRISAEVEELVVRFARENSDWGYDRIVGALANLGHQISFRTRLGDILVRRQYCFELLNHFRPELTKYCFHSPEGML